MDVLGGPADSFDPTSLMTAAPGGGGGASLLDGIAIRLQVSNGIPIQVRQTGNEWFVPNKRRLCDGPFIVEF